MKHAVSNRKPIAKSITEKPVLKNAGKATKPVEKKPKSIVSAGQNPKLKPTKKIVSKQPVQTVKPMTQKAQLFKSAKTVKSKVVEKVKPSIPKAKANSSAKKIKSAGEKNKAIAKNGNVKTNLKKAKPVVSSKLTKSKNQKLKPAAMVKKAKLTEVSKKSTASVRLSKTLAKKTKQSVSAAPSNIKSVKSLTIGQVKKAKFVKPQPTVSVKKAKLPAKIQTSVPVKKNKSESVKAKAIVAVKKAKSKIAKTIKNKVQTPKLSAATETKLQKSKAVSQLKKVKPIEKKIKSKNVKSAGKVSKPVAVERIENKIEPTEALVARKAVKKKNKPISSAVFRGKKERYDFKVFALNEKFEAIPAVYVISKRKIDKRKKGHHALICIGATDSISDELKKHKKGKCVKKYEANVVSILPEADEKIRLKIETDLKAAHSIPCVHT